MREFAKLLQEEMGNGRSEGTSAQTQEAPLYVLEYMKFIQETTEDAGQRIYVDPN
jgi:hypothetical protein